MQHSLSCLVALFTLAFGALAADVSVMSDVEANFVTQLPQSQQSTTAEYIGALPVADSFDTAVAQVTSDLVIRDDTSADSAQAGCWARADGDVKLAFGDGVVAMTTYVPSDDFPYDLSIGRGEIYCSTPPNGYCTHCWRNTTTIQVQYAKENSWCYFLFTNEYNGNGYESFYVHWYQGLITLHNPGFIKVVMCHDEDESRRKRAIDGRADALSQSGCTSDLNSLRLDLGMGLNNFAVYVPADGQSHRLGQPNPELQCSNFGQCKDCTDTAEYVYLRDGPATSHCDMWFTESVDGGYSFGVSITKEQNYIKLEKPGVLAMATCFMPGKRTETWISRLIKESDMSIEAPVHDSIAAVETPRAIDAAVPSPDDVIVPETRSLSIRDDDAGCSGPQDSSHMQMYFGTDGIDGKGGYNFSSWIPVQSIPYLMGQPTPQLYCQRAINGTTKCADCWSPLLWIYFPKVDDTPSCTILVSEDLNGGGMTQLVINTSPILYKFQKEVNLVLISCSPHASASAGASLEARSATVEEVQNLVASAQAKRDGSFTGRSTSAAYQAFPSQILFALLAVLTFAIL